MNSIHKHNRERRNVDLIYTLYISSVSRVRAHIQVAKYFVLKGVYMIISCLNHSQILGGLKVKCQLGRLGRQLLERGARYRNIYRGTLPLKRCMRSGVISIIRQNLKLTIFR